MRRAIAIGCLWIALSAAASAQSYEPGSESIIRPAGYGWRNHVVVPDGPCGCGMPVRSDCYDPCCFPCGLRPLCLLHRVGRMLDCLLPCGKCGHGCVLGGRGCCGGHFEADCGATSCHSPLPLGPQPYIEGPMTMPAIPKPTPASDVRYERHSAPRSYVQHEAPAATMPERHRAAPWKITAGPAAHYEAASDQQAALGRPANLNVIGAKPMPREVAHSVLRRTSAEMVETSNRLPAPSSDARPIVRSQSPSSDDAQYEAIPHNPLR